MSKSTMFLIGGILIAVLVVGGALLLVNRPNNGSPANSQTFQASFVATKTTKNDCYVIYEDSVYKIPVSWFTEHPGGSEAILQYCGKDLTEAFNGNPEHKSDADAMLGNFYVGKLVK